MSKQTSATTRFRSGILSVLLLTLSVVGGAAVTVQAAAPPPENPKSGSVGLEGTISSPPPSRGPTITSPANGRAFTTLPVTVTGLCPEGIYVKIFSNNIFVGATECQRGSYSLQIDLFNGQNELVARVYDALDQAGPDSNIVNVTFSDAQATAFGGKVSLTSGFAKRGANPGDVLNWPILLSGGTGPYAMSIDWGDGSPLVLRSIPFAGNINIDHIYKTAGIYRIVIKVTDRNGIAAYLQLIGVANGAVSQGATKSESGKNGIITITKTEVLLWPSLVAIPLILSSFWIGRRYELLSLRKRLEQSTASEYR